MQKAYCDLCKKEIPPGTHGGGVMRNKDVHQMIPVPGAPQGPPGGQVIQKRIMQEVWDLCQECQIWTWEQVILRQKELEKKEELLKKEKQIPRPQA